MNRLVCSLTFPILSFSISLSIYLSIPLPPPFLHNKIIFFFYFPFVHAACGTDAVVSTRGPSMPLTLGPQSWFGKPKPGVVPSELQSSTASFAAGFAGCMRDLEVDGRYVVDETLTDTSVSASLRTCDSD
jgi:hypothetical protein